MSYFAFIQSTEQPLLSVLCESGVYLKYSLQTEELMEYQQCLIDEIQGREGDLESLDPIAKGLKEGGIAFLTGEERMKINVKEKVFET